VKCSTHETKRILLRVFSCASISRGSLMGSKHTRVGLRMTVWAGTTSRKHTEHRVGRQRGSRLIGKVKTARYIVARSGMQRFRKIRRSFDTIKPPYSNSGVHVHRCTQDRGALRIGEGTANSAVLGYAGKIIVETYGAHLLRHGLAQLQDLTTVPPLQCHGRLQCHLRSKLRDCAAHPRLLGRRPVGTTAPPL
jgi:hypothetical protein